jgi:hypothetical protein
MSRATFIFRYETSRAIVEIPIELPPGVELWKPGDRLIRPTVMPALFHGPIGEFSQLCAEHTEADPLAILAQTLTLYGVCVGRGPHILAGNSRHAAALYMLIVGRSAKGGKGTALAITRELIAHVDKGIERRIMGGFGSGEALIDALVDTEPGQPADHRLAIIEVEFGGPLSRMRRDSSTLSQTMRAGWDGEPLSSRTRGAGKRVAEGHHIGAIGHITADELLSRLSDVEIFAGTANRWLHVWSSRGPLQPDGGNVPEYLTVEYGERLSANLRAVRKTGLVKRTPDADELWRDLYRTVNADDPPGILGQVLSRAAPQCLRLSLTYALADGSSVIEIDHVRAAWAMWTYCRDTAALIYGSTGDMRSDRLLTALRDVGADGLMASAGHKLFNNKPGVFDRARDRLELLGLAWTVELPVGTGRRPMVTFAVRSVSH